MQCGRIVGRQNTYFSNISLTRWVAQSFQTKMRCDKLIFMEHNFTDLYLTILLELMPVNIAKPTGQIAVGHREVTRFPGKRDSSALIINTTFEA